MGMLNGHGGGSQGGDWVGNALNLAGGTPGATPATPAAPGSNIPQSFWGRMIYRMAQHRHAAGQPTPFGDHMGWFTDPAAAQTPAAQPPVPAPPQSSLASLLGMPAAY